jgi:hypothetical protein
VEPEGGGGHGGGDRWVAPVLEGERRHHVDHEVADDPAAERGDEAHEDHAEQVQALGHPRRRSRGGEDRHPHEVSDEQRDLSRGHRLVDLLALRADRGALLGHLGHGEGLPAQRDHEGAHDRTLSDLLFTDIVEHLRTSIGVLEIRTLENLSAHVF